MLERAIEIAVEAHRGQMDKAGKLYILHPLRVMLRGKTQDEMIVGILHDTVEDTPVTLELLRREGFSEAVLEAISCITKEPGGRIQPFHRPYSDQSACHTGKAL